MAPVLGNAPWGGKRPAGSCPPLCDRENTKLGLKYYTSQVFFHISMYLFYRSRAIDFVNAFPLECIVGWGLKRMLSQVLHEAVIDSLREAWLLRLGQDAILVFCVHWSSFSLAVRHDKNNTMVWRCRIVCIVLL